ncbi:hypothetical protein L0F63_003687 [Massospora cicadina]|nr:hypothetical protein L0F63_003687 [Massospora cicadina]
MKIAYLVSAVVGLKPHYLNFDMLHTIQSSGLLKDGKYFVDMVAKSIKDVDDAFYKMGRNPSNASIIEFLDKHFYKPGSELDIVNLEPYPALPSFINDLKDESLKAFGKSIHDLWKTLVRRYNGLKECKECESSFLELKYDFVIPGGRFREFYYWDSFFVMEGLNLCDLERLSRSMLDNFLDIVDRIGFIPNGARKYFLNRSQPPFLIASFFRYFEKTKDVNYLRDSLALLDKEYDYWRSKHDIQVDEDPEEALTRYFVENSLPRPESYVEDNRTVEGLYNYQRDELFAELAAGAESGWDYSSRWVPDAEERIKYAEEMIKNETAIHLQEYMLRGLKVTQILPVDLNSIMYFNERRLAEFHRIVYETNKPRSGRRCISRLSYHLQKAKRYDRNAEARAQLMQKYMWDEVDGSNNLTSHRKAFGALKQNKTEFFLTPTTHIKSQLQWDQPNTWAPLEYISVEAMLRSHRLFKENPEFAGELYAQALDTATNFTQSALCAWYSSGGDISETQRLTNVTTPGYLFEKYNAAGKGFIGGGGEYTVQIGFGWTNGVILHFINLFKDQLTLNLNISACVTNITIDEGSALPYGMDYKV